MSLDQYDNLTLEQKFAQASFIQVVKKMTIEQSKYFLIELHRSMIVKEIIIKVCSRPHGFLICNNFNSVI